MPSEIEFIRQEILELRDEVARAKKDMDWLMQGNISSKNVREIGDYLVGENYLRSRDGDVGLSSANNAQDPVRLWAGGIDKDTAPWRVHKSGFGVATGWRIQSKDGSYPMIVMDPDNDLFGAYGSPTQSIVIKAYGNTLLPYIEWTDGADDASMYLSGSILSIISSDVGMNIEVFGDLDLRPVDLYLFPDNLVYVQNWNRLYSIGDFETLDEALSSKATAGAATNTNGAHNHGIPAGATWTTSAGPVTWSPASAHAHNQT